MFFLYVWVLGANFWVGSVSQGMGTQPANAVIPSPPAVERSNISKLIVFDIVTAENAHLTL